MLSKKVATVDEKRCVGCGACMGECPKQAVSVWKGCFAVVEGMTCVGCGKCAAVCPSGCIEIKMREENRK